MIRFPIYGRAVPKGRPRMTRAGGVYTPKTTVDWEKIVASAWFDHYGMMALDGRLKIIINVHTDRHQKQDVDNLAKSVLDGLQRAGAFAEGDQQVYILTCTKYPATDNLVTWVTIQKI